MALAVFLPFLLATAAAQQDQYIVVWQNETFADAELYCQNEYGTNLASIHDDTANIAAISLCAETGFSCWIGLTDQLQENAFVWSDGAAFDFGSDLDGTYPWSTGSNGPEPNNFGENEDCTSLFHKRKHDWDDKPCTDELYFCCNAPLPTTVDPSENVINRLAWWWYVVFCIVGICFCLAVAGIIKCVRRQHKGDDEHVEQVEVPAIVSPDVANASAYSLYSVSDVEANRGDIQPGAETVIDEQEQKNDDEHDSLELQLEDGRGVAQSVVESEIDPNRNYKPEGDRASIMTPNANMLNDGGHQREQSESSKTRSSDSSMVMHEDHWAALKVTNFAGVDESQKLEIFDRDENGEQNAENAVNGLDTKGNNTDF